jgi:hypothetical protein
VASIARAQWWRRRVLAPDLAGPPDAAALPRRAGESGRRHRRRCTVWTAQVERSASAARRRSDLHFRSPVNVCVVGVEAVGRGKPRAPEMKSAYEPRRRRRDTWLNNEHDMRPLVEDAALADRDRLAFAGPMGARSTAGGRDAGRLGEGRVSASTSIRGTHRAPLLSTAPEVPIGVPRRLRGLRNAAVRCSDGPALLQRRTTSRSALLRGRSHF